MGIIDLIFPKNCLECKKEGLYICRECFEKVPRIGWSSSGWTYSVWRYRGAIRKAIIALKYKYVTQIADELVNYLEKVLKTDKQMRQNNLLIPIPLHWYRENLRGFNQTEILGEKLAKKMGWKFNPNLLVRTKQSPPQAILKREERLINLKDVFTASPDISKYKNCKIIIFDDVITTGSTLNEAAKALKKAGVKNIWGLTVAK